MTKEKHTISKISFWLLLFYIFFGFIFSQTTVFNSTEGTVFYFILLAFFIFLLFINSSAILSKGFNRFFALWLPYLLVTVISCVSVNEFALAIKWFLCLIILLIVQVYKPDFFFLRNYCFLNNFFRFSSCTPLFWS